MKMIESLKTPESLKSIVVAAIRRHSMHMNTWENTHLWDDGRPEIKSSLLRACILDDDELPILYSHIDSSNWTLATTARIWHNNGGKIDYIFVSDVINYDIGDFKGLGKNAVERMVILSRKGTTHYCPYETNYPSMGTIYAVRTLCQIAPREG